MHLHSSYRIRDHSGVMHRQGDLRRLMPRDVQVIDALQDLVTQQDGIDAGVRTHVIDATQVRDKRSSMESTSTSATIPPHGPPNVQASAPTTYKARGTWGSIMNFPLFDKPTSPPANAPIVPIQAEPLLVHSQGFCEQLQDNARGSRQLGGSVSCFEHGFRAMVAWDEVHDGLCACVCDASCKREQHEGVDDEAGGHAQS
jgi:hypothetical protein